MRAMSHGPAKPDPTPEADESTIRPVGAAVGGVVEQTLRAIIRAFLAVLGGILIIIGVPLAIITPFPFVPIGLPVVISGVVLLGRNSDFGRRWMEGVLAKYPKVERFAPNWLMKIVFGRAKTDHSEQATPPPSGQPEPTSERAVGPDDHTASR